MGKGGLIAILSGLAVVGVLSARIANAQPLQSIYDRPPASASIDPQIDTLLHYPPLQLSYDSIIPIYDGGDKNKFLGALEVVAGFEDMTNQNFSIRAGIRSLRCGEPSNLNLGDFHIVAVYEANEPTSEVWGITQNWVVRTMRTGKLTRKTSHNFIKSGAVEVADEVGNYAVRTITDQLLDLPITLIKKIASGALDIFGLLDMERYEEKYGLRFKRAVKIEELPVDPNLASSDWQDVLFREYLSGFRSSSNNRPILYALTCKVDKTFLMFLNRNVVSEEGELELPIKH